MRIVSFSGDPKFIAPVYRAPSDRRTRNPLTIFLWGLSLGIFVGTYTALMWGYR